MAQVAVASLRDVQNTGCRTHQNLDALAETIQVFRQRLAAETHHRLHLHHLTKLLHHATRLQRELTRGNENQYCTLGRPRVNHLESHSHSYPLGSSTESHTHPSFPCHSLNGLIHPCLPKSQESSATGRETASPIPSHKAPSGYLPSGRTSRTLLLLPVSHPTRSIGHANPTIVWTLLSFLGSIR